MPGLNTEGAEPGDSACRRSSVGPRAAIVRIGLSGHHQRRQCMIATRTFRDPIIHPLVGEGVLPRPGGCFRLAGNALWQRLSYPRVAKSKYGAVTLLALLAVSSAIVGSRASAAEPAKRVLVLYDNNRLLPANVLADQGINQAISASNDSTVVSAEFLDAPQFDGAPYRRAVTTFLRAKYAAHPPDVIVAAGDGALGFLLDNRQELFPSVPLVHMGVDVASLRRREPLPVDVVGVPVAFDFTGTIEQALKWHPKASRLLLVTGSSEPDRQWEARLRAGAGQFQQRVSTEFLAGLPTAVVLKRLGELNDDAVVFTPGYFRDGSGRSFTPREAAAELASVSGAPVYGPYNTFIGAGIVGGFMPSFEEIGRMAGTAVARLLDGAAPGTLQLPKVMPVALNVDWRQILRWGIDPDRVPRDAIVRFRTPTFWETYRAEAWIAIGLFLLQSLLVAGLLFERRRRRKAEAAVDKHRFELAHASRLATAGELTASIAHEINQPLGAILSNVSAAELMFEAGPDRIDLEEIRQILGDIHRDTIRASEVIRRLRALLSKHDVERRLIDLNESLGDMAIILRAEAQRRSVALVVRPSAQALEVLADRVQVQQVLLNLTLNAIDAATGAAVERRTVTVSAAERAGVATITVRDRGHGIASEHMPRLFDSFFSTKRTGIGLGLSIVRTLVEAQGGTVSARNEPGGGAAFEVEFPLARAAPGSPGERP
ncbi:sensor histidine kinase [Ancylobacter tetraedralis]